MDKQAAPTEKVLNLHKDISILGGGSEIHSQITNL